jgi:N-glycosylase/DNA lyase
MQITIPTPEGFSFRRTVLSHGWCELPPFEFDQDSWTLVCVFAVGARPVTAHIRAGREALKIQLSRRLSRAESEAVKRAVRHIFRFDEDLAAFYTLAAADADLAWVVRVGAGRLLCGASVFEDLVKTICTTNCSWGLTKKMVAGLVTLGEASDDGRRAFPTPEALAAQPEAFYREVARAGYRAPYFAELAERVLAGELDVESWRASPLPTDQLKREMKRVKGVGDYAAENLLKLVGRYDGLTLDSWVRPQFYRQHNGGQPCDDAQIAAHYERYGAWRGLALWCDVTREWLDDAGEKNFNKKSETAGISRILQ